LTDRYQATEVRRSIRQFIERAAPQGVRDDDDIFELNVVDSLFAMQLVLFVEDAFSMQVEQHELDIKYFSSIDALTSFVLSKLSVADR
jgi:acyl carrier protein